MGGEGCTFMASCTWLVAVGTICLAVGIIIDIIANGMGLETDDVMRPTSVTGVRFLDSM